MKAHLRAAGWMLPLALLGCGGGSSGPGDLPAGDDGVTDVQALDVKPLKEMLGGRIDSRVRFVIDKGLEGKVDVANLKEYVLSRKLREADRFDKLTAADNWWEDYQDSADILYYSAEHVFSEQSPYKGARFMPHVWEDITYGVAAVSVEFIDLTAFYDAIENRKTTVTEPAGTAWTLLSANDGFEWARKQFQHAPDEMVVVLANNPNHAGDSWSYWFAEEDYGAKRGFTGHYFNAVFDEWPAAMQKAEGLKPHDLPIWMHHAFLNGEWDPGAKKWRLFPNGRWGGYDGANIYIIESGRDLAIPDGKCDPKPKKPVSHYWLDEKAFKACLTFTERVQYDWYRLWRHAFNCPSYPFWWSEKVDIRVVVVDLRDRAGGKPEYDEADVIDWKTVEDAVKEANPMAGVTIQRYTYTPPDDVKAVLLKHFVREAEYPLHSDVRLPMKDGTWKTFHQDWHHHFDIPGLPGLQVYLADKLNGYFGGIKDGAPAQYDPFAAPYHETGRPFVIPALFFLTPNKSYGGRIGGWTANTGELMCIFATQFGFSCEDIQKMMLEKFGQPVGPNLNAWSDAYGLWWEIFVVDWTYTSSPVRTLRFLLDPAPFKEMLEAVPDLGVLLSGVAPVLFDQLFGKFHPWASGFPFWLQESLADPEAKALSRQFASYQFAESLQHNIGYKHQTTVIFDSPYLGMEDGFDYRKHKDLGETFKMSTEQATMPFYSTEPGSRDFPIDANSYMTLKMGAGTRHMLGRIFARREVVALYEHLASVDPAFKIEDKDFQEAVQDYVGAAGDAVAWRHAEAYGKALKGLTALDRYFTSKGEPDRLHTDWDSPVQFVPATTGLTVGAAQLDAELKKLGGGK